MTVFLGNATMLIAIFYVFLLCPPQTDAVAPPSSPTAAAPSPANPPVAGALVVFQWPMAYCQFHSDCFKPIIDDRFLLHGVWPFNDQGVSIQNCGIPYSHNLAKSVSGLDLCWSGLNRPNKVFWKYEWDTHGSCSGQNVLDYFTHSRNLCKQYNKNLYLKIVEAGIRPSTTTNMNYPNLPVAQAFFNAINNKLNIAPIIVCKTSAEGMVYLLEIRLCATADLLTFQNCTRRNDIRDCGQDPKKSRVLFYTSSYRFRASDYQSILSLNATSTKDA